MNDDSSPSMKPELKPGLTALDWAVTQGLAGQVAGESQRKARRHRRRRWGAGATLVLVGAITLQTWLGRVPTVESIPAAEFAVMEARQFLPDGTMVDLKDEALVVAHFTAGDTGPRRVTLNRGQAHFEVAHDATRPFIVSAGALQVRAVGTAFAVDLSRKAVEVVVTEGRVVVEESPIAKPDRLAHEAVASSVIAGQRVRVELTGMTSSPRVEALPETEITKQLAWRVPRVEFSGTPLSEALPLFNRYSRVKVVLADPLLGQLQLSGVLRPDATASLVHLLKAEFDLESEPRGANELVLRRK